MEILFLTNKTADNKEEIIDFIQMYDDKVIIYYDKIGKDFVKNKKIDFIVSDRYQHIIKQDVLDYVEGNAINTHPSLLSLNKGFQPNFFAVYNNTRKGVTIHYMDKGLDTGNIIAQQELFFDDDETLRTTHYICRKTIIYTFCTNWYKIKNNDIDSIVQQDNSDTNYKKRFDIIFKNLPKGWDSTVKEVKEYKLLNDNHNDFT
jgi:methionyl-tRNA formyltransferase